MDDLVQAVVDEVLRRQGQRPALLVGLDYRRHVKTASRALWSALLAAERRLRALGVQELAQKSALVTAAEARRLLHSGLPVTGRLTPLARDVLEGRA